MLDFLFIFEKVEKKTVLSTLFFELFFDCKIIAQLDAHAKTLFSLQLLINQLRCFAGNHALYALKPSTPCYKR